MLHTCKLFLSLFYFDHSLRTPSSRGRVLYK